MVRLFVQERFGRLLGRSSCWNYLKRLGFTLKRPKKRLLRADADKRRVFVATYLALRAKARTQGAKIFFADEAHFRADVELRAKWVQRGQPALCASTSPRLGEKADYYSAVCLESGEVEAMPVAGNTNAQTSVAFLRQLREQYQGPLIVIWDNGPAHHGPEIREYLTTPGLNVQLVALPGYSPDFNADEPIWAWVRTEATANTCFGTAAKVRERVDAFFAGLADRTAEVKQRCRTELQAQAEVLAKAAYHLCTETQHVVLTMESL